MDFVTSFLISTNWKDNSYNLILVIIDQQIKIVYYEPVKVTIDVPGLTEVIINIIVYHYRVSKSIITDWDSLFTSKLWFSLYYFLKIKKK